MNLKPESNTVEWSAFVSPLGPLMCVYALRCSLISPSLVVLGAAAGLVQHRVQFVKQTGRHHAFPAGNRFPALTASLRGNGQRLLVSGCGGKLQGLANIHGGSFARALGLHGWVAAFQAAGHGAGIVVCSCIFGGPRTDVTERSPPVCLLWSETAVGGTWIRPAVTRWSGSFIFRLLLMSSPVCWTRGSAAWFCSFQCSLRPLWRISYQQQLRGGS